MGRIALRGREDFAFRHPRARFRAASAGLHAFVHVADLLAIVCATAAYFGAHPAGQVMQIRSAQHEVRARLADLGAIHHQAKMRRLHVFASHFEAMIQRGFVADVMAFQALADALFHFRIHVTHDFGSFRFFDRSRGSTESNAGDRRL
jgi:hypothetical protein